MSDPMGKRYGNTLAPSAGAAFGSAQTSNKVAPLIKGRQGPIARIKRV